MKPTVKPLATTLAAFAFVASLASPAAFALEKTDVAFRAMDANGDAVVTEAEYVNHAAIHDGVDPEGAKLRFDVIAGEDRELTPDEFRDAIAVLEPGDITTMPHGAMPSPGET